MNRECRPNTSAALPVHRSDPFLSTVSRHLFSARFPDQFVYLILEVRDADDQNLIRIFPQYVERPIPSLPLLT